MRPCLDRATEPGLGKHFHCNPFYKRKMLEAMPFDIICLTAEFIDLNDFLALKSTCKGLWRLKLLYSGQRYPDINKLLFKLIVKYRSCHSLEKYPILSRTILNILRKSPIDFINPFSDSKDILPLSSTVLHHLTFCGFYDAVKLILDKGINPNQQNSLGQTPLFISRNYQITKLLISYNVELDYRDLLGRTAIFVQSDLKIVKLLVNEGADITLKSEFGYTVLHYLQSVQVAEYYVNLGLDLKASSEDGSTPLHTTQDPLLARYFISQGVDVNARNLDYETALFGSEYETAQVLLDAGAAVNCQDVDGNTALFDLERSNSVEVLELLIERGGDVNMIRYDGRAPIHFASLELVETLVENGADINARDDAGLTPLFTAFERFGTGMGFEEWRGFEELVFKLISLGADVDAVDNNGQGVLHYAPSEAVAQLFIDFGCDVNGRDYSGRTPLHCARDVSVANCLISNGAKLNLLDRNLNSVWTDSYVIKAGVELKIQNLVDPNV